MGPDFANLRSWPFVSASSLLGAACLIGDRRSRVGIPLGDGSCHMAKLGSCISYLPSKPRRSNFLVVCRRRNSLVRLSLLDCFKVGEPSPGRRREMASHDFARGPV